MSERQKPFTVVGGKDHAPGETNKRSETGGPLAGLPPLQAESELIRLNQEIRANLPANYKSTIHKELLEKNAADMMGWNVAQLYTTLSQPDLWTRPSHTVAALEEVRLRMLAGSMAPRR